ncbi:AEC family transporter [Salinisphaera sp.]|uniref:AEC family transporter n=1 Tax=Salinisphaera sp. TaxID=1914330 RepID=UPI000C4EEA58|nr:AEC family transporter [Salinisphaera sp.]MAS08667.1 transporter [Salinisphaera sp.]|tara:strand:+ start:181 stop:1143 length:963 start_codon:yes stop_codon:yes gene_type:complete
MSAVINVLLPIFGLILAGFAGRRTGVLGETAAGELNRFVVWFCLPALLFNATATASFAALWHPEFIAVNGLASLGVFATALVWRIRAGRPGVDAAIDALAAAYANVGYVGIPLCVLVLGDAALAPALIATLIVVCVVFALAIVLIEVFRQSGQGIVRPLMTVTRALSKNPIVVAPIIGGLWGATGVAVAKPVAQFVDLLGAATTPCALVSIGAFLARPAVATDAPEPVNGLGGLLAMKLIVHPGISALLAYWVFDLAPVWAISAVLLAALPTGTGPYMLADFYGREPRMTSRVILWSTVGSIATLALCLMLLPGGEAAGL